MPQYASKIHTVDVGGVRLSYSDLGARGDRVVVLLHGGASRAATWQRLASTLSSTGYRVVAPDLRGHGGSARTADYPLVGFHDDIVGLLDALALDRVAMVGHSLGGYVASLVAQRQPARVTRLVLEEPPPPPRDSSAVHPQSKRTLLMFALMGVTRRQFHRRAVVSAMQQLSTPDPDWWDRLSMIQARTLVISGGPTSHIPQQPLAEVAEAIADCQLITIPVGHRVHSRGPDRFQEAVVPFLA